MILSQLNLRHAAIPLGNRGKTRKRKSVRYSAVWLRFLLGHQITIKQVDLGVAIISGSNRVSQVPNMRRTLLGERLESRQLLAVDASLLVDTNSTPWTVREAAELVDLRSSVAVIAKGATQSLPSLWISPDATDQALHELTAIPHHVLSQVSFNGRSLLSVASDDRRSSGFWITDGTDAGSGRLTPVLPNHLTSVGGVAYFIGLDSLYIEAPHGMVTPVA